MYRPREQAPNLTLWELLKSCCCIFDVESGHGSSPGASHQDLLLPSDHRVGIAARGAAGSHAGPAIETSATSHHNHTTRIPLPSASRSEGEGTALLKGGPMSDGAPASPPHPTWKPEKGLAAAKGAKFGSQLSMLDDDDSCPTCLEAFTDDNPKVLTKCGHAYHLPCIFEWLERSETCPICGAKMECDALAD